MPRRKSSWFKRIALTLAALLAVGLLVSAVIAWRATRVPGWYAVAVEQTPPDDAADTAIRDRLIPLQNWLARTSAGDLDAKPDAEKVYALELTEADINAILAKVLDNQHGEFETFRTRLSPGLVELGFKWSAQGRTLAIGMSVDKTPAGAPTIALGGVQLGDQGIPLRAIATPLAEQVRAMLQSARSRPPRIDDNATTNSFVVEQYTGRVLLNLLAGRAVSPNAFLPVSMSSGNWAATRVTRLDVSDGKLAVTFRLLSAEERQSLVAELTGPLPGN